jgi:tetratricopeptide (TPR) repeat protein
LVWGLFLILLTGADVDTALVEKSGITREPPLVYLKKSLELDPDGFAGAINLRQIARGWMAAERTVPDAEKLLKLAIELHPQSGALYEGLGEVYVKLGQNSQAIESYRKALTLDPNLKLAKEALKTLSP